MRATKIAAACLIAVAALPAAAQQGNDDLASKIVNDPGDPQVNGAKAALHDDAKVQGGKALRVQVAAKGRNPWDSFVGSAIKKPVKAGDNLLLVFWARLEKGEKGASTATLPYSGIQLSASPWTPLFHEAAEIGPEWKAIEVKGKADKDYAAGSLGVTIHLATAKQTVDFGPIVVLDLGK